MNSSRFSIVERLETAQRELLDFSLRNSMLNYRQSKARGLELVNEDSENVFRLLVQESRSMCFLPAPDKSEDAKPTEKSEQSTGSAKINWLQTNYSEKNLQSRLLTTFYSARTYIEERGANILFLALGMLHWYEEACCDKELRAPIFLIPVELSRTNARERFTLKYSGEDIDENLSLAARLKTEFGINLPVFPEDEELRVDSYLAAIKVAISSRQRWRLEPNEIVLGFFSFGKFLMYRDLDNGLSVGKLAEHPLIRAILGEGFCEPDSKYGEEEHLDQYLSPYEINQVVDADSSQTLAILDVKNGRNLVVQGPPGAGKSQTITNIIAEAVGQNKRVLFVSEKIAALEVVKRFLDKVGLGDLCLELHSHNANKKTVLAELSRTFNLGKPTQQAIDGELERLIQLRNHLNEYCSAVNSPIGITGFTPFQVFGELLKISDGLNGATLPKPQFTNNDILSCNRSVLQRLEGLVSSLQKHLKTMGVPAEHPFKYSQLKVLMPSDRQEAKASLTSSLKVTQSLRAMMSDLADFMGLRVSLDRSEAITLLRAGQQALNAPHRELAGVRIKSRHWLDKRNELNALLQAGAAYSKLRSKYDEILLPEAWNQDLLETRVILNTTGRKWWRIFSLDFRRARKRLPGICKTKIPKDAESLLEIIDAVIEAARHKVVIQEHQSLARELFCMQWQGENSDWSVLSHITEWIIELYRDIGAGKLPDGIVDFLSSSPSIDSLANKLKSLETAVPSHSNELKRAFQLLEFSDQNLACVINEAEFSDQEILISTMLDRFEDLQDQIGYNNITEELKKQHLEWVISAAYHWRDADKHLISFFRHVWFETVLRKAYNERKALMQFKGSTHEEMIRQFRELDILLLKYNRIKLASAHWKNLPAPNTHGQVGVLLREFEKKSRHLPIRQLMSKAGNAVQAIKPVFMMSPMSIASFLELGSVHFDLVIFDEASQIKPVDAFGAIARAKQLVVVGDNKQMPPTSFFDSIAEFEEIDDEDNVTGDIESILGLMAGQKAPQRMLRWHYRSRDESLIAVSNKEFYDSRLFIFPGPDINRADTGLIYRYLPNTIYDRGGSRTNKLEALAVAKAVMEHARSQPDLTLGVVAFSLTQMNAIIDELELLRQNDPSYEAFFSCNRIEPFFIKNLESVQGDERDVIFISIGYGRNAEGYVPLNFGALNKEGGERRLNVLITRARMRCEVFTNLTADDIDLSRTKSRAMAVLKTFLKYAQTRIMDVPDNGSEMAESVFEEQVAAALREQGYEVRHQVGSAGFRLDLGIVDPEYPSRYILGIECDGASYHSSRSARDRDRLRQQVLENLGWRIHRIWSSDWFAHTNRELKRTIAAIEQAKARSESLQSEMPIEVAISDVTLVVRDEETKRREEVGRDIPDYEFADIQIGLNGQELHTVSTEKIISWITEIVRVESPVHPDEVTRRIADTAGVKRIGNRIQTAINNTIKQAVRANKVQMKRDFLWQPGMDKPKVRGRSNFPSGAKKIEYVSIDEVAQAIKIIVQDSLGIEQAEIASAVCRILGFGRATEEMCKYVNSVLAKLIKQGSVNSSNGYIALRL